MKTSILLIMMILSAPFVQASEVAPQCAPTGWSCRQDPCCSITDYCNVSGTCTPNRPTSQFKIKSLQEISHRLYSLMGLPSTQSAPMSSIAQF